MSFPYIITTKPHFYSDPPTEHAVATLDEARSYCRAEVRRTAKGHLSVGRLGLAIARMPETGGTIGPLPDGTVIEVRRANA